MRHQYSGRKLNRTAAHRKMASIVYELDGFKDGGPLWDALM